MSRRGRVLVVIGVAAVVVTVVVWRVATAPDLSAVPLVAQGPYLCDGVPQEGAELILGGQVEVTWDGGEWGSDGLSFHCTLERRGGMITVDEEPISRIPLTGSQMWLEQYRSSSAEEFEADAPGHGFASTQEPGMADWSCGERHLMVVVSGAVAGRDKKADVVAYLTSMLPWACGGQDPPEADS